MNRILPITTLVILVCTACDKNNNNQPQDTMTCEEYWMEVNLAAFCNLSLDNFDITDGTVDICNADQGDSWPFDDRVSVRVYNHSMTNYAVEEFDGEVNFYSSEAGFTMLQNIGDEAMGVFQYTLGRLDVATIFLRQGTFTISVWINGDVSNGASNCFDESTAKDFARALAAPL